jgi:hypothetical protein
MRTACSVGATAGFKFWFLNARPPHGGAVRAFSRDQIFPSSSGIRAKFTAIRRASSWLHSFMEKSIQENRNLLPILRTRGRNTEAKQFPLQDSRRLAAHIRQRST